MTTKQVKAIGELLKRNGIEATKQQVLSACLLSLINAGLSPEKAMSIVCGEGSLKRLVDSVYRELTH